MIDDVGSFPHLDTVGEPTELNEALIGGALPELM